MTATKIRSNIIETLLVTVADADFSERSDQIWIYATLANCLFAVGRTQESEEFEKEFLGLQPADWQSETYFTEKSKLLDIQKREQ